MKTKVDVRTVRTKNAIKKALIDSLKTQDLLEISIKELAVKAKVDRKSIYNYYKSTYQILDDYTTDVVNMMVKEYNKIKDSLTPTIKEIYKFFNQIIADNEELFKIFIKVREYCDLSVRLREHLVLGTKNFLLTINKKENTNVDVIANFLADGILGLYRTWLYSDQKEDIYKLADDMNSVLYEGINSLKISN